MEFKQENIGKVVFAKRCGSDPQLFRIIIGYNPVSERYISYQNGLSGLWENYCTVHDEDEIYPIEYAIKHLDNSISLLSAQRDDLLEYIYSLEDLMKNTKRENFKNELGKLWQAYSECVTQLSYFNDATQRMKREIFKTEIREVTKAIRRLDKRFYFFFGDQSEIIQDAIRTAGPWNAVRRKVRMIDDSLKKLGDCKKYLLRASEKMADNIAQA